MASVVQKLDKAGKISPPSFVPANMVLEVMTGSVAYGVATDMSDVDVLGVCVPPQKVVFPHLAGEIPGFGRQKQRFDQFQQHGVKVKGGKVGQYDLSVYSIIKYFQLCMDNNPNMVDSLFSPLDCVLHCNHVGNLIRENRHLFLHKGSWHKFKGYAYSQLHKMRNKEPEGKRAELVERHGYDVKFAYHVVRLLGEARQILEDHDLDPRRDRELLKAVRRGDLSEQEIRNWAAERESELEKVYHTSTLRHRPAEDEIRALLLNCLEHHYGSLENCVVDETRAVRALAEVRGILEKYDF